MELSPEAREARNAYHREWRKNHPLSQEEAEALREYKREWRRKHPTKTAEYQQRYWEKQAALKAKEIEFCRNKTENHRKHGT